MFFFPNFVVVVGPALLWFLLSTEYFMLGVDLLAICKDANIIQIGPQFPVHRPHPPQLTYFFHALSPLLIV
jgi:hypothetical protein